MLSFTTAHVAVIALRIKEPDRDRPYRTPWNIRMRGTRLPLTRGARRDRHVRGLGLGASCCTSRRATSASAWMVVRPGRLRRSTAAARGSTWRATTGSSGASGPADFVELELPLGAGADLRHRRRRLGAARGGQARRRGAPRSRRSTSSASRTSCRSTPGSRRRSGSAAACSRARSWPGGRPGSKVADALIRTRSPGAAIVEEAQRRNAEIIYLGTAHAPPSERALGPTATLLARPSAVPRGDRNTTGNRPQRRGERREHATGSSPRAGRARPLARASENGRRRARSH